MPEHPLTRVCPKTPGGDRLESAHYGRWIGDGHAGQLFPLTALASCAIGAEPNGSEVSASDLTTDQTSSDVTVLKAEALDPIPGNGAPDFAESDCALNPDGYTMDCTAAFEARFDAPAIDTIDITRHGFFCRLLRVITVSKKSAVVNANGIGFFYKGFGGGNGFRVTPRIGQGTTHGLKKSGDVTLKSGEAAELHEFVGLSGCWLGSSSSSYSARYEFKPFMQFTGDDGNVHRNWDAHGNYQLTVTNNQFDRSGELLR